MGNPLCEKGKLRLETTDGEMQLFKVKQSACWEHQMAERGSKKSMDKSHMQVSVERRKCLLILEYFLHPVAGRLKGNNAAVFV